jgi:RimJ/RimL family protein N-acetyltransferase
MTERNEPATAPTGAAPRRLHPARRETARMMLEPLAPAHAGELQALFGDPRVARWVTVDGRAESAEQVARAAARNAAHWTRHGFGVWLLRDRETGELLGQGGLQRVTVEGVDEVEAAWSLLPARWGCGYATELAELAIAVAFEELGVDSIVGLTLPDNHTSRRVMERTDFRYEREIEHAGLPHVLYRRGRW